MTRASFWLWTGVAISIVFLFIFGVSQHWQMYRDDRGIAASTTSPVVVAAKASNGVWNGSSTPGTQLDNTAPEGLVVAQTKAPMLGVWKQITIGTYANADLLEAALKRKKIAFFGASNWMLHSPTFSTATTEAQIDLVNILIADLGFLDGAPPQDVYRRAQEFGLALCPSEVAPQLLLQHEDVATEDALRIAMQPISIPHYDNIVFGIWRSEGGFLFLGHMGPGTFLDPEQHLVFCLPSSDS